MPVEYNECAMHEYVNVRASESMEQGELVAFLKQHFPRETHRVGRVAMPGTETIEARFPANSDEFLEVKNFINSRRNQKAYRFVLSWMLRKYKKSELETAEILLLRINPHFEPSGEECGTIYTTLCRMCNLGRQESDLILDVRRAPQHKDIAETIAWVEWIVSARFVRAFEEKKLSGAEFKPVYQFTNPTKQSKEWQQLRITGSAGDLADTTVLGRDAFTPSQVDWRCPLGHSLAAEILSEVYIYRRKWDGSDIAITSNLFGQGRNLLRPAPLIIISQRLYQALISVEAKGFSVEVAHLV